jgi:hypothetical protein
MNIKVTSLTQIGTNIEKLVILICYPFTGKMSVSCLANDVVTTIHDQEHKDYTVEDFANLYAREVAGKIVTDKYKQYWIFDSKTCLWQLQEVSLGPDIKARLTSLFQTMI